MQLSCICLTLANATEVHLLNIAQLCPWIPRWGEAGLRVR
jgi:hypothetical protein